MDANVVARRKQADVDMIVSLKARCAREDRANVEEEELDEHPLLAGTSIMHYVSAPMPQTIMAESAPQVAAWTKTLGEHMGKVEAGRAPFHFDAQKYISSMAFFKYVWAGREAFAQLVIDQADKVSISVA